MEACSFAQENCIFGPPRGVSSEDCETISAWRGPPDSDEKVVVTCWKVTKEELEEIQRTGRVYLIVQGSRMPPVCLLGHSPFTDDGER